jgi:hypothetical protein
MSFMKKIISLSAMVVASFALSAFALAAITLITTTTAPFSAYADQSRFYTSEAGDGSITNCDQQLARQAGFNNCSQLSKDTFGEPVNPATRENCETFSDVEKCKQVK